MKSLLFAISAACCVCVAGARVVDDNLALNVQDGDVQTFDEDLLFQGWSRVFTIPAGSPRSSTAISRWRRPRGTASSWAGASRLWGGPA